MGRKQCFEERKSSQKVAGRLWRRSWDLVILRNEDEGILKVNPEEDGEVEGLEGRCDHPCVEGERELSDLGSSQ